MTIIYDMASGTQSPGDELSFSKPNAVRTPAAPVSGDYHQVELRLELVEPTPCTTAVCIYPVGLDMESMLDNLED